jgi:ABC-2 type transport system permease protein
MKNTALTIIILVAALFGINYVSSLFHKRLDLTEEKRYTIADPTQSLLKSIDGEVFVKVYLTGENLPGGFKRLENAVKQTLDDFQVIAGNKIGYRFIDLNTEIKDEKARSVFIEQLAAKGIPPTNVFETLNGRKTQSLIVPGAVISYNEKELGVLLLKGNKTSSPQETLNQATENVEFELADAIKQLTQTEKKKIGFFVNYSSLPAIRQIDLINTLKKNYQLFPVDLVASDSLAGLDAIFVMKPDKPFTEADKFKIDQFIVKGGKALFFIDPVKIDTVGLEGNFAKPASVNLEDLFFKYGIRLNSNVLKDMEMSASIPMNVGNVGDKANIQLVPWPYFPLINTFGNSPIVRNLDRIYLKYPATIDTIKSFGIKKTPLLISSNYSQTIKAPATISFNSAAKDFEPNKANEGAKVVAYLLEGSFESLFSNTILPTDPNYLFFKKQDKPSKIIIVADGDLPTNDVNEKLLQPLPLGFDKYSQQTFGNKDFVKNAVDYLLNPNGIIAARSKTIKLRPLDKVEVAQNQTKWQMINLIVPLILLSIIAALFFIYTKKKYASV